MLTEKKLRLKKVNNINYMNGDEDVRLGAEYYKQQDYERAIIYFERAAEQKCH